MADSLRDQLLKSGLVKEVREEKKSPPPRHGKAGEAGASSSSGQPYAGNRPKHGGAPGQAGNGQRNPGGQRNPNGQRNAGGQGNGNAGGNTAAAAGRSRDGNRGSRGPGQAQGGKPSQGAARPPRDGEIDLAKAYALRAQTDASERRRAEAEAAEVARLKREKKRKVEELLKDKALNKADADQVRHFPYGEKIRRVYLDAAQLVAVNAGELGIVQQGGRYLVVDKTVIAGLTELAPEFIALMVDPDAVDESSDGVPDDLMW